MAESIQSIREDFSRDSEAKAAKAKAELKAQVEAVSAEAKADLKAQLAKVVAASETKLAKVEAVSAEAKAAALSANEKAVAAEAKAVAAEAKAEEATASCQILEMDISILREKTYKLERRVKELVPFQDKFHDNLKVLCSIRCALYLLSVTLYKVVTRPSGVCVLSVHMCELSVKCAVWSRPSSLDCG